MRNIDKVVRNKAPNQLRVTISVSVISLNDDLVKGVILVLVLFYHCVFLFL